MIGYLKIAMAAIICLFVLGTNIYAEIKSARFEQVITSKKYPNEFFSNNVWIKGNKMRSESSVRGEDVVMIFNDDAVYTYYVKQNFATKMNIDKSKFDSNSKPADILGFLKSIGAQVIASDDINGAVCSVYEGNDNTGKITVWIWDEKEFPLKMIYETPQDVVTVVYKNVDFSSQIGDNVFELPANARIADMPIKQ